MDWRRVNGAGASPDMHPTGPQPPLLKANVDPSTPQDCWPLEALAAKMLQYCPLMTDVTAGECCLLWFTARGKDATLISISC